MAYGIPLWNEETGWTPLDELPPGTLPTNSGLITGGDPWGGGQSIPSSNYMTTYQEPPVIGSPGLITGGDPWGGGQSIPSSNYMTTYQEPPNSGAGNDAFNAVFNSGTTPRNTSTMTSMLAPTGAQVQANPQAYAGTSFDPNRTLSSGLPTGGANNMSMTGAENVGGMGMYTGSNGPLDTTRFTPVQGQQQNGPPPGSIPTGDPNTWITPWGATYTTPGSINNSSSAAYDAYRQRAYGDMMGPMGRGPNTNPYAELSDVLRQVPGSINAQTFQGYLGSLQGQQTGPYPPQQTAPLPPQSGGQGGVSDPYGDSAASMQRQEQVRQAMRSLGISEYGPALTPQQIQQLTQRLGYNPITQAGGPSQRPGQPGQTPMQNFPGYNPQPLPGAFPMGDPRATWGGMYDAQYGQGAYQRMQEQERARQDEMLASVGLRRQRQGDAGYGNNRFMDLRSDPLGIGVDIRDVVATNGSPVNWEQLTQQYGANKFGGNKMFQPQPQPSYGQNPYQMQQSPVIGSPGMMGPGSGGMTGQGNTNPYGSAATGPAYGGFNGPIYHVPNDDPYSQVLRTSRTPMYPGQQPMDSTNYRGAQFGGPGQMQVGPAMPFGNQRGNLSPDAAAYYYAAQQQQGGQQPNYQQMAAQFSSDPASQAAFIRDFTGYPINYPAGGQQSSNPQNVDFRAATFGGSLFPAPAGGSGSGNTNIPNTTNPSTSQYSQPMAGWGGATNRRGGFGGMSLFGNQFGSGGSTGFGGVPSSQYRGAGSYGRPASYGQSQRPY